MSQQALPMTAYEFKPPPAEAILLEEWKKSPRINKIIKIAIQDGHINLGWTYEDYLYFSAISGRYELSNYWGIQGSGKSSFMLASLFWIYKDWDQVLKHIVFTPKEFVSTLKAVPRGRRIPALGWDDVLAHFPSTMFKTAIDVYESIDRSFAVIRKKCPVIMTTLPIIDRLAKNLKDNTSFEVYMGRNQRLRIFRVFRLPNLKDMSSNLFKVPIEPNTFYELDTVPWDVFKEYDERRLDLTEQVLDDLDKTTATAEELEGHMLIIDASELAVDMGVSYAPSTIQQDISRGVLRGIRTEDYLYVNTSDFQRVLAIKRHFANLKKDIKEEE